MRISDWNSDVCSSDLAIDIGKISLDGLSSEDVQDELNAVFSALGDTFAATVLPGISDFQRTGEGLYETLIRVASETSAVQHVFDAMRSEERGVGEACVSTCRSRWSPSH